MWRLPSTHEQELRRKSDALALRSKVGGRSLRPPASPLDASRRHCHSAGRAGTHRDTRTERRADIRRVSARGDVVLTCHSSTPLPPLRLRHTPEVGTPSDEKVQLTPRPRSTPPAEWPPHLPPPP
ncbi:unnamed protein product [Pleuronectes platessa]|uniref:Uncharacterized protein n=1 Tax=Pleuronectes platessa TaxID=8262 RepID=A0A9N7YX06_PLEPL|nr:unnamed protein product [Pleuronectes platessa]